MVGLLDLFGAIGGQGSGAQRFADTVKPQQAYLRAQAENQQIEMEQRRAAQSALRELAPKVQSGEIDSRQFLAQLATVSPEYAKAYVGSVAGLNTPSAIKEYQYFSGLSPEQQRTFLSVKRANQLANLGGSFGVVAPTGEVTQNIPVTPKPEQMPEFKRDQSAAAAEGAIEGTTRANAVAGLGATESKAEQALKTIDDLINDQKGLEAAVGMNSILPTIPGGNAADFEANLRKLQGSTFLEAYQSLKGGGQITEVEGQKAENAIAALQLSQSEEQFRKSLQDLREVIGNGVARERAKAGVGAPPAAPAPLEQKLKRLEELRALKAQRGQ
jgi:hypothetical protein